MNPENQKNAEVVEFVWRRLTEPCPEWVIGVPVVFAFLVVSLIFLFRQEISTSFKVLVGTAMMGLLYVAIGSGIHAKLALGPLLDIVLVLGLWMAWLGVTICAGILLRDDIRQALPSYLIHTVLSVCVFTVLTAFQIEPAFLIVYGYALCGIMQLGTLWEIRGQLAAYVVVIAAFIISVIYLALAYFLVQFLSWLVVLVPVLGAALFYVGMMYIRDMRSVNPIFAMFLGMLRCTVYLILALVFLLPGCQYKEEYQYESKVIVLFDVSGSMAEIDELPEIGEDLEQFKAKQKSRQDKIVDWLMADAATSGDKTFLGQVVNKSPLTMYRYGGTLDDSEIIHLHAKKDKDKEIERARLKRWLNPDKKDYKEPDTSRMKEDEKAEALVQFAKRHMLVDTLRNGTNIGGASLQALKLENNSFVQAIVIVSDGQSNMGSDDVRNEFLSRVNNPKRQIPVFTVGVGQFRLPVSIEMQDLQGPSAARPDDRFPIRVPVTSTGIPGEKFTVTLEVSRVADINGTPVEGETWLLEPKEGVFRGAGEKQQDTVEFEIDVEKLKGIRAQDDAKSTLEGTWRFRAKTPRHPKEQKFLEKEHVTQPIDVPVRKRPLRVLFFAGGATREYQFLRTIFYRETLADRMEMSIYLQNGRDDHVDQDVKQDRMLADFPDRIGPGDPKYMSLSEYDVVVAFDPDWSKLSPVQQKNLQEWVNNHAGGIVFVAGPVYSFQLSRPGAYGVEKLLSLYPVVPKDSRLHGSTLPSGSVGHNASRPYALHFSPAAKDYDFLKLDESGESPTAGWNKFFWNDENTTIALGMDTQPKRGFYNYYPVERLKPDSQVIATFAGPAESRLGKSNAFKDHQPFLVTMRAGSGKTLYIGSGELWRLRGFKDGYHDRIWIKMARYVAAGATQQKKYGHILMAQSIPVGVLQFEAQLKGKDLQPLAQENRPTVFVERVVKDGDKPEIQKFDLQPKPGDGDWHGNFVGSIHMKEPGEYRFKLPIPGIANESLEAKLFVRRLDPEKDNLRTNFGYLFQMASETSALKKNLSPEQLRELERYVQVPTDLPQGVSAGKRLFFQAESADAIAKALVTVQPKSETVKGRLEDLWDRGFESINGIVIAVLVTFLLGMIVAFVFFSLEWWIVSALTVLGTLMMTTVVLAAAIFIEPINNLLNVDLYYEVNARNAVVIAPIVVGLVGGGILLILRQWISALVFVGICAFGAIVALVGVQFIGVIYEFFDIDLPVGFSLVMVLIVTLLGIEWLARKLLRLA